MTYKRSSQPRPVPLVQQRSALDRRYPGSKTHQTRTDLIWSGELTPTEYSDTYELLLTHRIGLPPLAYVVRPRLSVVPGERLPHVYKHNVLCLHTLGSALIGSRLLSDTMIPWATEWLFFYETWLATGGHWAGEGAHPLRRRVGVPNETSGDEESSRVETKTLPLDDDETLARLRSAVKSIYRPSDEEMAELMFNALLGN